MKKLIILLMAIVLTLSLASCGGSASVELDLTAISAEIDAAGLFLDTALQPVKPENVAGIVGLDTANCKSSEYHMGASATAEEWGLFECNSAKDAEALVEQMKIHNDDLMVTYSSYAPDAVPRIENAVIMSKGQYAIFITAEKHADAQAIADKYFK